MDSKNYIGLLTNETGARINAIPTDPREISWAGLVSLLLTLLNIAIILVTACAMFYAKSVVKYDGEGAEWSNEFKKYKAANYVIKNDGKGRLFAEKAKWVARLGGGHAKAVRANNHSSSTNQGSGCSSCCTSSNVRDASSGDLQMTTNPTSDQGSSRVKKGRRISLPMNHPGMTGPSLQNHHAHGNKTPTTGARPDALSLFGAPPVVSADSPAQALAAGVVEGHKTLNRLMSLNAMESSRGGRLRSSSSAALRSSNSMASSVGTPVRLHPEQITLAHINTPRSLFKGRRTRHAEHKEALSLTMRTVHAMRQNHNTHSRAITHTEYSNMAMAGLFDAPSDGASECHRKVVRHP